jgi:hypothetical protein
MPSEALSRKLAVLVNELLRVLLTFDVIGIKALKRSERRLLASFLEAEGLFTSQVNFLRHSDAIESFAFF